jgi:hypothetical protein
MVFKRKASFFLDLSGDGAGSTAKPVTIPVREAEPEAQAEPAAQAQPMLQVKAAAQAPSQPKPEQTSTAAEAPAAQGQPVLTTAEAIAAELRAAQESKPAPSTATFAPDCLNPANALPQKRRRAGANLAGFKAMGASLLRS